MQFQESDYQILKLTDLFYEKYPNPPCKEILKKRQRAYNCLLFQTHYNYFICIPFRTEISHGYAYHFKHSERSRVHKSGLDYTKMVIINDTEYIDDVDAIIDRDEFVETVVNLERIKKEALDFLEDYMKHMKGIRVLHSSEFKRRYQYSPLKYFHCELGLEENVIKYELIKQIREHEIYRNSFMELAEIVFGLSFRSWYENGFWTDKYIPYALIDGSRVAANASVNIIDTVWQGKRKRYIQIGTVMTHPDYRGQGLMRRLMENILADWKDHCDGIYLYANDSVRDFYPKFGFVRAQEYGYRIEIDGVTLSGENGSKASDLDSRKNGTKIRSLWRKLDMDTQEAREILQEFYRHTNPYSALPMLDNYGLLMFYCADFMKECVYYSPKLNAVCVASQEENTVYLSDVFGNPDCSLREFAAILPFEIYDAVALGFTPEETEGCICGKLMEDDTTLFVFRDKENVFGEAKVRMPELSHA